MSKPRSRNLDKDNVGIQTEDYLDESFAYVFRWILWLPIKILKWTYTLFRIIFVLIAYPSLLVVYGIVKVFHSAKKQYEEGYREGSSTEIQIE